MEQGALPPSLRDSPKVFGNRRNMDLSSQINGAKTVMQAYWAACDAADEAALSKLVSEALIWEGPWPIKDAASANELVARWAAPLRGALPSLSRRVHILTAGLSDGQLWVAGTGYLEGRASAEVFGIPASEGPLRLRWGEFARVDNGKIVEVQLILDFVDWFEQIGRPVLSPRGVAGVWPAPVGYDGAAIEASSEAETQRSYDLGHDLIFGGLNVFDESDLSSMGMRRFFHPNLRWYGPGGIGACLSFEEFETLHQAPWLVAFPDRKVARLSSLFAEDRMVSASGTMGVVATHSGLYQGVGGTGARLEISGLDFWLRDGDQFIENWVFVDMVKLFSQMGVDLFERMRNAT